MHPEPPFARFWDSLEEQRFPTHPRWIWWENPLCRLAGIFRMMRFGGGGVKKAAARARQHVAKNQPTEGDHHAPA